MADEENVSRYKGTLIAFMSYVDNVQYDKHHTFSPQDLSHVTADDVVAWMNLKAYGTTTPGMESRPTQGRSNSLLHYKKALSFFMPNRNHQWNELTLVGNPTKSQAVNDMIRRVKKFETRHQGAAPKARRPLTEPEFRNMLNQLRTVENGDIITKYGVPALLVFQFHLIGRVDDCCKFLRQNLQNHDSYADRAAKARLCWSKNVQEEREAPWQHLFGCMDWTFCVILNLGLWLEVFHATVFDGRQ